MTELRTEEEQVEAIKKWWRENGTSILLALVLGLGGYFGWNYWKSNQQEKTEVASALYNQLIQMVAVNQGQALNDTTKDQMKTLANELKNNFSGTTYSDFGALFVARFAADEGNYDAAAQELKALAENSKQEPIKYTAQARLAQVYIQQDMLNEALALVATTPDAAFAPQFAEAKGDVLYRQGKLTEAVKAYQEAQAAAQSQGLDTQELQRKIDSLASSGDA